MLAYYYLHSMNGALILTAERGGVAEELSKNNLVRMFWPYDMTDRNTLWRICIEAAALEANERRVVELMNRWIIVDRDADRYANRIGLEFLPGPSSGWIVQGNKTRFASTGATKIGALINLCIDLGFRNRYEKPSPKRPPDKVTSFASLVAAAN